MVNYAQNVFEESEKKYHATYYYKFPTKPWPLVFVAENDIKEKTKKTHKKKEKNQKRYHSSRIEIS